MPDDHTPAAKAALKMARLQRIADGIARERHWTERLAGRAIELLKPRSGKDIEIWIPLRGGSFRVKEQLPFYDSVLNYNPGGDLVGYLFRGNDYRVLAVSKQALEYNAVLAIAPLIRAAWEEMSDGNPRP